MRLVGTIYKAALTSLICLAASNAMAHSMLYAPSEDDDPVFRAAVSALIGGPVDYFDARIATPTVEQLQAYDCVHTWADSSYADSTTFGNNLASYVDAGGRAILVYSTRTSVEII